VPVGLVRQPNAHLLLGILDSVIGPEELAMIRCARSGQSVHRTRSGSSRDGLASIESALYSSSISLSAACSEERRELLGSGILDVTALT
jgi:hypothetical protein